MSVVKLSDLLLLARTCNRKGRRILLMLSFSDTFIASRFARSCRLFQAEEVTNERNQAKTRVTSKAQVGER